MAPAPPRLRPWFLFELNALALQIHRINIAPILPKVQVVIWRKMCYFGPMQYVDLLDQCKKGRAVYLPAPRPSDCKRNTTAIALSGPLGTVLVLINVMGTKNPLDLLFNIVHRLFKQNCYFSESSATETSPSYHCQRSIFILFAIQGYS